LIGPNGDDILSDMKSKPKTNPVGRPRDPQKMRRFTVQVRPNDAEQLIKNAELSDISLPEYLRRALKKAAKSRQI
jgi:predicted HicB family RNase H-like nuclease